MRKFLSMITVAAIALGSTMAYADAPELQTDSVAAVYADTGEASLKYQRFSNGTCRVTGVENRNKLTEAIIPSKIDGYKVTSINNRAFKDCTNLTSVIIPDSVTSIGGSAFEGCTSLTAVTIPDSVTSIGDGAFWGCTSLTSVTIPEGVTSIGRYAFINCTSLTSVTIPKGVTYIGNDAFSFCENLTSATILNGITEIESRTFLDCTSLTSVTIPEGVTRIHEDAFNGCKSLTSVVLPKGVYTIDANAFFGCEGLASVTFSEGLKTIDNDSFNGCKSLTSVTIPDGVTSIGRSAFKWCSSLTSVTIPGSTNGIYDYAFFECTSLKDVYYSGTVSKWEKTVSDTGNDCLQNANIHYNFDLTIDPWCSGNSFDVPVNWTFNYFYGGSDNYNIELSKIGLVLSARAEQDSPFKVETLLKDLGYGDIKSYNYGKSSSTGDTKVFQPAVTFGHAKIDSKDYFAIVIRGTTSPNDIMTDAASLIDGFSGAGSSTVQRFNDYVTNTCKLSMAEISSSSRVFITGHSLGGATAGCVTHELNTKFSHHNIYTYTTAAPRNCSIPILTSEKNIHNIICPDDAATKVPPNYRFHLGREWVVEHESDSNFQKTYEELVGIPYSVMNYMPSLVPSIVAHHSVETYMTHILLDKTAKRKVPFIGIECPVDIEIYDSNGNLVGRVINNVIDETVSVENVYLYVDGDHKYICIDGDPDEYTLKFTGTDNGTMKYYVQSVDTTDCEATAEKIFGNVVLEKGKEMISVVSVDNDADDTQIKTDIEEVPLYVLSENGKPEKKVLDDDKGTEVPVKVFTITLNAVGGQLEVTALSTDENGKILNKQLPTPVREGFEFNGWFTEASGGEMITADKVFNSDATLYAHWTKGGTEVPPESTDIIIKVTIPKSDVNAPSTGNIKADIKQNGEAIKTLYIATDGKTSLDNLADGKYAFTFSADNCAPRTYDVTVTGGTAKELEDGIELRLIGDINGDGKLTLGDVLKANAAARNSKPLTGYEANVVDINNDGKITLGDVLKMNAHARNSKLLW